MADQVLTSVKQFIGIADNDDTFDPDIIMAIGTALLSLKQLGGIGSIPTVDDETVWSDLGVSELLVSVAPIYVALKVRLVFDPPTGTALLEALKSNLAEMEFRITSEVETTTN
jgi:hypothetical protein